MTEATALPAVLARLVYMMDFLCRQIIPFAQHALPRAMGPGMYSRPMPEAVVRLAWNRVRRFKLEFLALAARIRAGTLRPYVARGPYTRAPSEALRARPEHRLPAGRGWLIRMEGHHAAAVTHWLRKLLGEPEMIGLLAATPRTGKLLSPICRALGVDLALLTPPGVPAPVPRSARSRPATPPRERKPTKREERAALRALILHRKATGLNAGEPGRPIALIGLSNRRRPGW